MDKNNGLFKDDEYGLDEFVPLARLLGKPSIDLPTLATAIEAEGVYSWDMYGRFLKCKGGKVTEKALKWLAKVQELKQQSHWDDGADYALDDLLGHSGTPSPFDRYGWPYKSLPDFDSLQATWDEEHLEEGDVSIEQSVIERDKPALNKILAGLIVLAFPKHETIIKDLDKERTNKTGMILNELTKKGYSPDKKSLTHYIKHLPLPEK